MASPFGFASREKSVEIRSTVKRSSPSFVQRPCLTGPRANTRSKARTKTHPTGASLAQLIGDLNPVILGWRTYYRYAAGAAREFSKLDWSLSNRVLRWLRKKHRKAAWSTLRRYRITAQSGKRKLVWGEGRMQLRRFVTGGTTPYPTRCIVISNGWDDVPKWRGHSEVAAMWDSLNGQTGLAAPAA